jgi:hypothetical protein
MMSHVRMSPIGHKYHEPTATRRHRCIKEGESKGGKSQSGSPTCRRETTLGLQDTPTQIPGSAGVIMPKILIEWVVMHHPIE